MSSKKEILLIRVKVQELKYKLYNIIYRILYIYISYIILYRTSISYRIVYRVSD